MEIARREQRFIAVRCQPEVNKDSISTNYVVTLAPFSIHETNPPVFWGAKQSRTLVLETTRPIAIGDEFVLYQAVRQP